MEYLTELKADNQIVGELIFQEINDVYNNLALPVSEGFSFDQQLLQYYLQKPGRGIGGSLVLRLSQLLEPGEYTPKAIRVAAATEVLNASILIIDDWLDDSDFRKNQATIHKDFGNYFDKPLTHQPARLERLAGGQTVQLGILALYASNLIILKDEFPEQVQILQNLNQGMLKVTAGNMLESRLATDHEQQNQPNILQIYINKTGYYSFLNPIKSGLILAGADEAIIRNFEEISLKMGLAFQFQDDLMGLFGNPEKTGKPNTDDIREGLYTILFHYVSNNLPAKQLARLQQLHGKTDITDEEVSEYRSLVKLSYADQIVKQRAIAYLEDAKRLLHSAWSDDWNSEVLDYLISLIDFLDQKDYLSS